MKTIAITIDENLLEGVKLLEKREKRNRSEIIREAVQAYIMHRERLIEQERERKIFQKNRKKLRKQAEALIRQQAKL